MIKKFLKYGVAGGAAFILDFYFLYALITWVHMHYLIAVPITFIFATIINYTINRLWVFSDTSRKVGTGYIYFLQIALVGILLTMSAMYIMVEYIHVPTLWARIIAAGFVYFWSFAANYFLNFKKENSPS